MLTSTPIDVSDSARKLLGGKRVLLLEDSGFLGEIFLEMLEDAGCRVIGPYRRIDEALAALHREPLDAAVMDVCIHGDRSFDVASLLLDRNIPVLMVSGYGADTVPEKFRADFIQKPFDEPALLMALCNAMFKTSSRPLPAQQWC